MKKRKINKNKETANGLFLLVRVLFNGNAFCQVAGLVNITAAQSSYVIGKKLERNSTYYWSEHLKRFGNVDHVVGHLADFFVAPRGNSDNRSAACLDFLDVGYHFFINAVLRNDEQRRKIFVNQGDWAVFHLSGRVRLGVAVRNLFQFQSAFKSYWEVIFSSQIQKIRIFFVFPSQFFDFVVLF